MLLWIVVLVIGAAYLLHRRLPPLQVLGLVAAYVLVMGIFSTAPRWLLMLIWVVLTLKVALLVLPQWRQKIFSGPVFRWFQRTLPAMSQTEREAIDAGTVWWDGELFSGRPDWGTLLDYPAPTLSEEEQAFIDGPTEQLCAMVSDWQVGQDLDLTPEAWAHIKQHGFFALIIPKEYGGKGFSAYAHSQVAMKLATRSGDLASTVMVPNSLGPAELLLHYGTDEQRNHYLPRLARGDEIPCFALTGPLAGSDAGAMPDTGIICKGQWNGEEVLGLRLNWEKRYITLGPVATLLGLAFKAHDPDHLLGDQEDLGISLALIPTDTPGVEIGKRHLPLGAAFMNGPNSGKDVFVPLSFLIGGQAMLGKGWMMLMNCLSVGRSISLPAVGTGAAKYTSLVTGQYANIREQFNVPFAIIGGIAALLLTHTNFSISAGIGFIALFGICIQNGVILISVFKQNLVKKHTLDHSINEGVISRVRPVVMTALMATIGLMPAAISTGIGSETSKPLAIVVIGGLITGTILTLFIFPLVFERFYRAAHTHYGDDLTAGRVARQQPVGAH